MNLTLQFAIVVALCVCLAQGGSDGRLTRKQQRPTRGFKNVEMMTARGFGKRARTEHDGPRRKFVPKAPLMVAYDFGKRSGNDNIDEVVGLDNFWENLETSQERDAQEFNNEKTLESIPMDWFVNEIATNPDFARSVVHKFIDLNQDGMLSVDELLRNV